MPQRRAAAASSSRGRAGRSRTARSSCRASARACWGVVGGQELRPPPQEPHMSSSSASMRARAGGVNLRSAPCSSMSCSRSRRYCGTPRRRRARRPPARARSARRPQASCSARRRPRAGEAGTAARPATATSSAGGCATPGRCRGSSRPFACSRASAAAVIDSSWQCTSASARAARRLGRGRSSSSAACDRHPVGGAGEDLDVRHPARAPDASAFPSIPASACARARSPPHERFEVLALGGQLGGGDDRGPVRVLDHRRDAWRPPPRCRTGSPRASGRRDGWGAVGLDHPGITSSPRRRSRGRRAWPDQHGDPGRPRRRHPRARPCSVTTVCADGEVEGWGHSNASSGSRGNRI